MPKSPTPENHNLSSYQSPGYLLYNRDLYYPLLYGILKSHLIGDPIMKQSGFHGWFFTGFERCSFEEDLLVLGCPRKMVDG